MKKTILTMIFILCAIPVHAELTPWKKVAVAQGADVATTVGALTLIEGAVEMNPLGLGVIIPLKVLSVAAIPFTPPEKQYSIADRLSNVAAGYTVNNLLAIAGAGTVALPAGIAIGSYLLMCDARMLPQGICPFTETITEEMDRRISRDGADFTGFRLSAVEAERLIDEIGYIPSEYKGIAITVEDRKPILISSVDYSNECFE